MPREQKPEYTAQILEQRAQTPEPGAQSQEPEPQARKRQIQNHGGAKSCIFPFKIWSFFGQNLCSLGAKPSNSAPKILYVIVDLCLDSTTRVATEATKPEHMTPNPRDQTLKPQSQSPNTRAESREPRAKIPEPITEGREPMTE